MSIAKKAPARAKNSAKQGRIYCDYKSGSEAAKATVAKQKETVGAIRATCCFAVWGDTPTKADYEGVSDAVSRVSHMEGIAAKMSLCSDEQKQMVIDALLTAKVSQLQDFVNIVHYSVIKDPNNKTWKTGKGKTRKLTANVGVANKTKVKKAVERVIAKKADKDAGKADKQPQDKSGKQPAEQSIELMTAKRKATVALQGAQDALALMEWSTDEATETARKTLISHIKDMLKVVDKAKNI